MKGENYSLENTWEIILKIVDDEDFFIEIKCGQKFGGYYSRNTSTCWGHVSISNVIYRKEIKYSTQNDIDSRTEWGTTSIFLLILFILFVIISCYIVSVLLCGSECWTIQATEMWLKRRILDRTFEIMVTKITFILKRELRFRDT